MKRRDYKNFGTGTFSHIYNRGNNKEDIFLDEQDYKAFLYRIGLALGIDSEILNKEELLKMPVSRIRITKSPTGLFKLHSFCLMPNHFHLLIEQCGDTPISTFMSKACTSFSMYMNKKHKRVGHIFQDRFKSVLIENNPQLLWTTSYIHMNPVKSKIVSNPEQYKWSSYNDFASDRNLPITHKDFVTSIFENKENLIKQTLKLSSENTMSRTVLDS